MNIWQILLTQSYPDIFHTVESAWVSKNWAQIFEKKVCKKTIVDQTGKAWNAGHPKYLIDYKKNHKFLDKSISFWLAFEIYCFYGHA